MTFSIASTARMQILASDNTGGYGPRYVEDDGLGEKILWKGMGSRI